MAIASLYDAEVWADWRMVGLRFPVKIPLDSYPLSL